MYWIIVIGFMIASAIVGHQLKRRFEKYSKLALSNGMTGKQIAEKMLRDHGITDVDVISVEGQLTDHYNPANRTVNLSNDVYHGRSISAAAVAAHECGHAIQHANAYTWLEFRSALVPLQNISAKVINVIFIIMMIGTFAFQSLIQFDAAILVIIAAYGVFTLFSMVTLPVEINASQRALAWLNQSGVTNYNDHDQAKDALKWAAYTYVVAALSSLAMLLYYVALYLSNRD